MLLCGNGGSAADSSHISGELLKGFLLPRTPAPEQLPGLEEQIRSKLQQGIPAIPLNALDAAGTAFLNDVEPSLLFAQLTFALGRRGDVFFGISTSGNAENVCAGAKTARALGMATIALTGRDGGRLARLSDCAIIVPEEETYKIQELHLPVYHSLCAEVEAALFGCGEN